MTDIDQALSEGAGYPWRDLDDEEPTYWMVTFITLCRCNAYERMGPWRRPPGKLTRPMDTTTEKRNRRTGKFEVLGTPMERTFLVANYNPHDRTAKYVEQVPKCS